MEWSCGSIDACLTNGEEDRSMNDNPERVARPWREGGVKLWEGVARRRAVRAAALFPAMPIKSPFMVDLVDALR